jgi:dCTP diphosphatase
MSDKETSIDELKSLIESFVDERDWKQFHSPKNISMSISIEAAELMELFQWLSLDEAKEMMKGGDVRDNAIDEIADVMIYAIAFCNRNDIDISDAIKQKMKKNIKKYPTETYKGHF